jgi:hypothetical protein
MAERAARWGIGEISTNEEKKKRKEERGGWAISIGGQYLGLGRRRAIATGTARAGSCLIHHHLLVVAQLKKKALLLLLIQHIPKQRPMESGSAALQRSSIRGQRQPDKPAVQLPAAQCQDFLWRAAN